MKSLKPENKLCYLLFCMLFLAIFADHCRGAVIERKRLRVKHDVECYIPYASNLPIDQQNPDITHLVIAVYSAGSDVYNGCIELLEKDKDQNRNVIVVSPQFLTEDQLGSNSEKDLLYWRVRPFYGSKMSTTKSHEGDLRISAYDILEKIIFDFCEKQYFPNLKMITILGHSAGGQLVNRFAASNTVEFYKARPQGIMIKYIPMNPSSYIYFSPKRSVRWSRRKFEIPSAAQVGDNPGYNNYSYGLNALYSYHTEKGITPEKMRELYPHRNVVYLIGDRDYVPGPNMSTHPSAMMQGRNRLERCRIYYGHLIDEFGSEIRKNQKLRAAKGVGHNGKAMILSAAGRVSILKNGEYDDVYKNVEFTGHWVVPGLLNCSNTAGAAVEYSFQGKAISWIGRYFDDAGKAKIEIDGKEVAVVDQYGPVRDEAFRWKYEGLEPGRHKIVITVLGEKNLKSRGHWINIEKFLP